MISGQFAVSGKINILARLREEGYTQRYIDNHLDKYHYFLHVITEKKVFNKAIGAEGFVAINMRYMESFLGRPYANDIRTNLLTWGYIQCNNSYCVGKYPRGYRIHPDYQGKAVLRDILKVETMVAKLAKLSAEYQKKNGDAIQLKNLKLVGIHHEAALAFIDKKYYDSLYFLAGYEDVLSTVYAWDKKNNNFFTSLHDSYEGFSLLSSSSSGVYSLMSDELLKKAFHVKENEGLTAYEILTNSIVNQYNTDLVAITKLQAQAYFIKQKDPASRVFTNVSNLNTDLRQFLYHRKDKAALVNLDIRNSQPYLFSLLLTDYYGKETLPEDVREYIRLTSEGKFYEYMMREVERATFFDCLSKRVSRYTRKTFKIKFFASLFFCQNHHAVRTTAGKVFRNIFPNVYTLIHSLKADDYRQLAITMQRREAGVILGTIGKELRKRKIWNVTIHDSVVVTEDNAEAVKSVISEAFRQAVGVAPSIEEDRLCEPKKHKGSISDMEVTEAEEMGAMMMLEGWENEEHENRLPSTPATTAPGDNAATTKGNEKPEVSTTVITEAGIIHEPNLSTWGPEWQEAYQLAW